MISITSDTGLSLDMMADQNLVTEQAVPWLSDDELPGEFSYPIDVPLTENNKRFVSHGYRPDLARPFSEMPVSVRMDGVLYRRCTFAFRINSGKISGFLKIDASEFYDKIRKLSLLEALPDPVALGDGLTSPVPVPITTRLKQIAALKPGSFPFTFFPIRNQAFLETSFGDKLSGFVRNDYVNAWERLDDGTFGFPVDLLNMPKFGYLLCPQFYLSFVLQQIITKLAGYTIESDWLATPEAQAIVVFNQTAMNQHLANLSEFISGHQLVPGLFMPDMSVADFLKAVKGKFGLVFTYNANDRICRITQFTQTVQAGAAIDLTPYQVGDYSSDYPDGKGYTVTDFVDSADELYKDTLGNLIPPVPQVTGLGQQAVTLKAGTTQLAYEVSPLGTGAYWFVPTVRQPGNVVDVNYKLSDTYLTKDGKRPNSIGLKFLFYRGMTTDTKGNPYPLGTPDVRSGQQVTVGTQALTLGGRVGAWQSYLMAYYYFRNQTQRITQNLLMPVSVVASLQLDRLISLSLEDYIRRSYLISKLQADAPGIDGKVNVRLEVLTLPSGIEQTTTALDPVVWIELLRVASNSSTTRNGVQINDESAALTIKCWQDAQRTQAAIVTNLPITVRAKKTWAVDEVTIRPDKAYEEVQLNYLVNGAVSLIDPAFVTHYSEMPGVNFSVYWDRTVSLDPGEGYTILPG